MVTKGKDTQGKDAEGDNVDQVVTGEAPAHPLGDMYRVVVTRSFDNMLAGEVFFTDEVSDRLAQLAVSGHLRIEEPAENVDTGATGE